MGMLLLALGVWGCAGDASDSMPPYYPDNLIKNGSMESVNPSPGKLLPEFWRDSLFEIFQGRDYRMVYTDSVACCGSRSVYIETGKEGGQNYAIWYQDISSWLVPAGRSVRLSVRVKTQDLKGRGFEFGAMCRGAGMRDTFFTSQAWTTGIVGSRPWLEYVMTFAVPAQAEGMQIWLALQTGSTGRVYFDNVEFSVL